MVESLVAVHMSGLRHCDFSERNVVINDKGEAFIIDFDHAELHKCERKIPIVFLSKEPTQQEFECDEIYWMCRLGRFWHPRELPIAIVVYRTASD